MKKIGICTGGGDAPGLNAVIRAVVKFGAGQKGWELYGIEECFNGLIYENKEVWPLTPKSCQGLLHRGGTILGTTNRGKPFGTLADGRSIPDVVKENFDRLGLEGIIVIGGDGTQEIGYRLMTEYGIPVVGVPKTIDNDLASTDFTFGFWSAVDVATEALDRLHTTAESHDRVMILEVMGRTAGWIALYAGVAGGADCIAIPELPYSPDRFVDKILKRKERGRHFTLIIVAEGAMPSTETPLPAGKRGAGEILAGLLEERTNAEIRLTVLGHLQRGGSPVPFDRVLATRYGIKAVELVERGRWGELACLRNGEMTSTPLAEVTGAPREVSPAHSLIAAARSVGIDFGMDPP
jgi:ATP-dependent phosphofructokinase / diphosphate-dependent phosphofructokinase